MRRHGIVLTMSVLAFGPGARACYYAKRTAAANGPAGASALSTNLALLSIEGGA